MLVARLCAAPLPRCGTLTVQTSRESPKSGGVPLSCFCTRHSCPRSLHSLSISMLGLQTLSLSVLGLQTLSIFILGLHKQELENRTSFGISKKCSVSCLKILACQDSILFINLLPEMSQKCIPQYICVGQIRMADSLSIPKEDQTRLGGFGWTLNRSQRAFISSSTS